MAVLNRCAVTVSARPPMVAWTRPFGGRVPDPSLYLLPAWESEEEAERVLATLFPAIFESELELWCRDRSRWPEPRSLQLFRQWFEVLPFPLVEDLGSEPLHAYVVDGDLTSAVREALR